MSAWPYAVKSIGAEGLLVHNLRHTGNQFAANSGAGLKDLMTRMGHDSERAALIYQHERAALTSGSRMRSTLTSRLSAARATMTTAQQAHSFRRAKCTLIAREIS